MMDKEMAWNKVNGLLDEGKGGTREYRDAFKTWQQIALKAVNADVSRNRD